MNLKSWSLQHGINVLAVAGCTNGDLVTQVQIRVGDFGGLVENFDSGVSSGPVSLSESRSGSNPITSFSSSASGFSSADDGVLKISGDVTITGSGFAQSDVFASGMDLIKLAVRASAVSRE